MNIILASKSPRRFELLNRLIEKFVVIESNFDENSVKYNGDPEEYVKQLSPNVINTKLNVIFDNL